MNENGRVLYPMLGVGAFFGMFWVGFVVGYELGLTCAAFLANALLFACLGTYFVVRLERRDRPPPPDLHPESAMRIRTESVRIDGDAGLREPAFVNTRVAERLSA